jgi:hypothetical protein
VDEIPVGFECPITLELMQDPVIAEDGHSYEQSALKAWFDAGCNTSPMTNTQMGIIYFPNHALRKAIEAWQLDGWRQ